MALRHPKIDLVQQRRWSSQVYRFADVLPILSHIFFVANHLEVVDVTWRGTVAFLCERRGVPDHDFVPNLASATPLPICVPRDVQQVGVRGDCFLTEPQDLDVCPKISAVGQVATVSRPRIWLFVANPAEEELHECMLRLRRLLLLRYQLEEILYPRMLLQPSEKLIDGPRSVNTAWLISSSFAMSPSSTTLPICF